MTQTLGLYLSVPFCKAKCTFCNFASDAFPPQRMAAYVDRLCDELQQARSHAEAHALVLPVLCDSVFLGGGTPSLLSAAQFTQIFHAVHASFLVDPAAEITCEAAPGQLADNLLASMLHAGVNRVSLGVQSFAAAETRAVGRLHTAAQCLHEVSRLRAAGMQQISLDLILGLPHQTRDSWRQTLRTAIDTGVDHLSVYMLEVDEDSRLGREVMRKESLLPVLHQPPEVQYGAGNVPDDEWIAGMYAETVELLAAAGLRQYEISNFAREGRQSRHNRKYWQRAPYLGCGLDAHSMLHGEAGTTRFAQTDDLQAYLEGGAVLSMDAVTEEQAFEESIFLGLRLVEGISLRALAEECGVAKIDDLLQRARPLQSSGLIAIDGDAMCLTTQGRLLSSSVFGELLATPVLP